MKVVQLRFTAPANQRSCLSMKQHAADIAFFLNLPLNQIDGFFVFPTCDVIGLTLNSTINLQFLVEPASRWAIAKRRYFTAFFYPYWFVENIVVETTPTNLNNISVRIVLNVCR